MTITNQNTKVTYFGNGVNRSWSYNFALSAVEDMTVFITSDVGVETRVDGSFYVDEASRAVIYPTPESELSPLPTGYRITLMRRTPLTQPICLFRHGELDAPLLESGYDRATMQLQELAEGVSRCIKMPVSSENEAGDAQALMQNLLAAQHNIEKQTQQSQTHSRAAAQSAQEASMSAGDAKAQADYIASLVQTLEFPADDTLSNVNSIAPESEVARQLALKAERAEVARLLAQKADQSALSQKADAAAVNAALAAKANKTEALSPSLAQLTAAGGVLITGLMQPDLNKPQSLVKDVVFQAEQDGFIYRSNGQGSFQGFYLWAADNAAMNNAVEISHVDATAGHYSSWHFAKRGWFYKATGGGTPWLVVFYPHTGVSHD